jgi:hypothetical protein
MFIHASFNDVYFNFEILQVSLKCLYMYKILHEFKKMNYLLNLMNKVIKNNLPLLWNISCS